MAGFVFQGLLGGIFNFERVPNKTRSQNTQLVIAALGGPPVHSLRPKPILLQA